MDTRHITEYIIGMLNGNRALSMILVFTTKSIPGADLQILPGLQTGCPVGYCMFPANILPVEVMALILFFTSRSVFLGLYRKSMVSL